MDNEQVRFGYTSTFIKQWHKYGLTDADKDDLEALIVEYYRNRPVNGNGKKFPGAIIKDTGGAYKYRFAPADANAGKSGSYRTIYFVVKGMELRFIDVYAKNEQESLSDADKKAIKSYIKARK